MSTLQKLRWNRWMIAAIAIAGSGDPCAAERGGMRQQPLRLPPGIVLPDSSKVPPSRPEPSETDPQTSERPAATPSTTFTFRGTRYVVTGGKWFEQRGSSLRAVTPREGVHVAELPAGYSIRWVNGIPYFHADGLYYVWRERKHSYEILASPPTESGDRKERPQAP